MLCERCRAEIATDPLPAELAQRFPAGCHPARVLGLLWRMRGNWCSTEWLTASLYRGAVDPPISAENCMNIAIWRLRRQLPPGYRIEARRNYGRRLVLERAA